MGSGNNGQFTFLDVISIMSFLISVENLEANLTQNDKQELQRDLSNKADMLLKEIHQHLEEQDNKIDRILKELSK